jgi:hypothetical protein
MANSRNATTFDLIIPDGRRFVIREVSGAALMPAGVKLTSIEVVTSVGSSNVGGNLGRLLVAPQFVGSEDGQTNLPDKYVFSQSVLAFAEGPNPAQVFAARTPAAVPDGQPQGEVDMTVFGYLVDLTSVDGIGPARSRHENVKGWGAIGRLLVTTGDISSQSNQFTVASVEGWKKNAGIGIQGAGPLGRALTGRVIAIAGNLITLSVAASTTVAHAVVTNDDSLPIQDAIDALGQAGGEVYIPAGDYMIGTKLAWAPNVVINKPLTVGSNTRLFGDGVGRTILHMPDEARQWLPQQSRSAGVNAYYLGSVPIINKNSSLLTEVAASPGSVSDKSAGVTVIPQGITGATRYEYRILAKTHGMHSHASNAGTTTIGNALLDGANFNRITWVAGIETTGYDIYRTVGGATTWGNIGSVGHGVLTFDDKGLVGDLSEAPEFASTQDRNIEISDMTIDGNRFGQSMAQVKGNRTTSPVLSDPMDSLTLEGTGPGTLVDGHTYVVAISYTDSNRSETEATTASIKLSGHTAICATIMAPAPKGASGVVVYLSDTDVDLDDNKNLRFEKVTKDPIAVAAGGAPGQVLTIATHAPVTELAMTEAVPPYTTSFPPGWKIVTPGDSSPSGINFDNASNIYLHDLELTNCVLEGYIFTYTVTYVTVERVASHNNGRFGAAFTGPVKRATFTDCRFTDNRSGGFDFEPVSPITMEDLEFNRCQFNRNGASGTSFGPFINCKYTNIRFTGCSWEDNKVRGFVVNSLWTGFKIENISLRGCYFRNNLNDAFSSNIAIDTLTIDGCFIEDNGRVPLTAPEYSSAAGGAMGVGAGGLCNNWKIIGNHFRPYRDVGESLIYIEHPSSKNWVITGNIFETNPNSVPITIQGPASEHAIFGNDGPGELEIDEEFQHYPAVRRRLMKARATGLAIDIGTTFLQIKFSRPMINPGYRVNIAFAAGWEPGDWWITDQKTSGCTIRWTNPPAIQSSLDYIAEM